MGRVGRAWALLLLLHIAHSNALLPDFGGSERTSKPIGRRSLQDCTGWACPAQSQLLRGAVAMDLVALQEAYASGADVNMKMDGGWTVLHLAAKRADINMARLLILWGADLDAKSMNGTTPLHMAANYGFLSFAMLLVVSGASVEPKDIQNFTPLHFAAYCNRRQEYDLTNVRAGGLTFAESAPSGDVPGLGANAALPAGISPNYLGIVELLIHKGATPSPVTIYQETPLHYVSTFDCYSIGQYLVGQGANINYQDIQGETPLHEAVAYGALGTTEVLLKSGANSYLKEQHGLTPREFICQCRSYSGNPFLNPCAPQRCMMGIDTEILEAIIDEARKEQG